MDVVNKIKEKMESNGGSVKIKLLRGDRYFNVTLREDGVMVDNLSKEPFLGWKVFEKTIELLEINGGTALKGGAMGFKLGEGKLPTNSIYKITEKGFIFKKILL